MGILTCRSLAHWGSYGGNADDDGNDVDRIVELLVSGQKVSRVREWNCCR
jgi:hypothetical protein